MIKPHDIKRVKISRKGGLEALFLSGNEYLNEVLRAAETRINIQTTVFTNRAERVRIGKGAIEYQVTLARLGRNLPIFPED